MLFNSWDFILRFLPAALVLFWLPKILGRNRLALGVLIALSYLFYAFGERNYPWLLGVSMLFNWIVGTAVMRRVRGSRETARALTAFGIFVDLAVLAYFKYATFAIGVLHDAGLATSLHLHVPLPVGISFYTFTQIAFLVDAFGSGVDSTDPLLYGVFVTLFPHLIAGPILHHGEIMPQLERPAAGLPRKLLFGGIMFVVGLFKKVVIADHVAGLASAAFGAASTGQGLTFATAWLGTFAYTVQIYFDFSGYSDMAVGLGRMFGIDLPINFNSPYRSLTISDFWRRWHITLSRFLRDYLYIPLGGNRRGAATRYRNLMLTMTIGGIWHGAGWTFLLWGTLHGVFLVVHNGWTSMRARFRWAPMHRIPAAMVTFLCVAFAWVPFRAPSLVAAFRVWAAMLGVDGVSFPNLAPAINRRIGAIGIPIDALQYDRLQLFMIVAGLASAWCLPNSQQWLGDGKLGLTSRGYNEVDAGGAPLWRWAPTLGWSLVTGAMFGLAARWMADYSEFIYFQF